MANYHTKQPLESETNPGFYSDDDTGSIAISMPWGEACALIELNHFGLASVLETLESAPEIRISDAQYVRNEHERSLSYVSVKLLYNNNPWLTVDSRSDNQICVISDTDSYIEGANRVENTRDYLTTLKNTQDTLAQTRSRHGHRGPSGWDPAPI